MIATTATMKACVLFDTSAIEVRSVPIPPLPPSHVRVRMSAVGICGTDAHIFAGHANYNTDKNGRPIPLSVQPQILGHEISGYIEEIGNAVRDLKPGDHVVVDQGLNCVSHRRPQLCEHCQSGDSHQCEFFREHGITGLPGGLAEFVTIPSSNAVRIDTQLDVAEAALVEPLGCVIHASNSVAQSGARYIIPNIGGRRRVSNIAICGAGPAGLLFVQYLRQVLGFEGSLLVVEPNPVKRGLAETFGADEVLDPNSCDVGEATRERTDGKGVEFLIEASGQGRVFASIPRLICKKATVLVYGHGHAGVDLSAINNVMYKEPTLVTPVGASGGFDPDGRPSIYREALHLIEDGKIKVAPIISHRYTGLDAVQDALSREMHNSGYIKGVVMPETSQR